MEETLDSVNGGNQRPTFLTVLCILTFIGSGLGVLGGLMGLMGSAALSYFAPQGTMISQIIGLLAAGLCLFGAIKMWGLYKQGFTFYLLGIVLSIVGAVVGAVMFTSTVSSGIGSIEGLDDEFGQAANAVGSLASAAIWSGVIFSIVINIVFLLLYNANRKHLVK
ncbi:MAG: hypothetical protein M9916_07295 [Crocinitomicaceae bacterium]|nr:hypothetical protein [Crocinitomicaceae bacterium]